MCQFHATFHSFGKIPQARHCSASAPPCASLCSHLLPSCCSAFPRCTSFPPFPYRSNASQPSNCPGPLGQSTDPRKQMGVKDQPSGLQFASQGQELAEKQTALFAKGILKQLPFTSAVQECWARQNNEPSVHSSLLPLSLSSGLKSELPKNGRVPLHLHPPCLYPAKTSFLPPPPPFSFGILFLRALAKTSFKCQTFVRWYSIYPALSSNQKMPPTRRSVPCLPSLEAEWHSGALATPFVQRREYHLNGRPPKICSPLLLAWCHCLLGLDSKLRWQ